MPKRIQRKRTKGWRLPANAKCVTRPHKFGNPFDTAAEFRVWLEAIINGGVLCGKLETQSHMLRIAHDIEELRGLDLACWCSLTKDCHADILIEFANRPRNTTEPLTDGITW
jgi:hypothetical protein